MYSQSFFVLLCIAGTAFAGTLPSYMDTELYANWEGRIVGGQNAQPGEIPYQASLRTENNQHFCGGTILNANWILTAAHCADVVRADSTRVVVGAHHRVNGGVPHVVSRVVTHPKWTKAILYNDIALLKLATPILFTASVKAIAIGTEEVPGGVAARASGWGQTSVIILFEFHV